MLTSDTIVAISSAAGSAARAVVRLSGPESLSLAGCVFVPSGPTPLEAMGGFRWADGLVCLAAGMELPARAYVFRGPRSYTRQDLVELHIPGSPLAAVALLEALIAAGARQALAGEFTARAFFSGRLDLSQAEAVADLIDAASDAQLRSAVTALGGRVSRLCEQAAGEVTDVLATVEASVDFADEEVSLAHPSELAGRLGELCGRLRHLAGTAASTPETAQNPLVVLAGAPNVGKSSLLNALTGTERAIVSALAGTTRDVLSAALTLEGLALIVQDAAGFAPPGSSLAAAADTAARRAVQQADVLLFVLDARAEDFDQDETLLRHLRLANRRAPAIVLANKADLIPTACADAVAAGLADRLGLTVLATSATTGQGLCQVRAELGRCLHLAAGRGAEALGLHERHRRHLLAAAGAAQRARELLAGSRDVSELAELAAVELRSALAELSAVSPSESGLVAEEVLGRIFARFCIGK